MDGIQEELKAPKNQTNAFGKYKYRSCEDIIEAVKPILAQRGYYLNISDEIVMLGDRFYVKATAKVMVLGRLEPKSEALSPIVIAEATGWAREAADKKGMDVSQITGAASSYSRKYALNGLFAIDDTKDADTHEAAHEPAEQMDYKVKYSPSIDAISAGIASGDLSTAAEEWYTLPKHAQEGLWVSTKAGGAFSTAERATMKTSEFRQAYYGEAK